MSNLEQLKNEKCQLFMKRLENSINNYNEKNVDIPVEYKAKYLNAKMDGISDLRETVDETFRSI